MDDLVPLYPVYALLMTGAGIGPGGLSALLALWSLTSFVLEVPSGALADRVSRRRLLAIAPVVKAAGFALWTVAPSAPAFAAGFVLWGAAGSLTSGTWEALMYDELTAAGAADRYPKVIARTEVLSTLGVLAGTGLAVPVVAVGGYAAAGWASVGTALAAGWLARG